MTRIRLLRRKSIRIRLSREKMYPDPTIKGKKYPNPNIERKKYPVPTIERKKVSGSDYWEIKKVSLSDHWEESTRIRILREKSIRIRLLRRIKSIQIRLLRRKKRIRILPSNETMSPKKEPDPEQKLLSCIQNVCRVKDRPHFVLHMLTEFLR